MLFKDQQTFVTTDTCLVQTSKWLYSFKNKINFNIKERKSTIESFFFLNSSKTSSSSLVTVT